VVIKAANLSELRGQPRVGVGGCAFGWGVGCDKMCDLGKAVVKLEVKGVWGGESRGGGKLHFGEKR